MPIAHIRQPNILEFPAVYRCSPYSPLTAFMLRLTNLVTKLRYGRARRSQLRMLPKTAAGNATHVSCAEMPRSCMWRTYGSCEPPLEHKFRRTRSTKTSLTVLRWPRTTLFQVVGKRQRSNEKPVSSITAPRRYSKSRRTVTRSASRIRFQSPLQSIAANCAGGGASRGNSTWFPCHDPRSVMCWVGWLLI